MQDDSLLPVSVIMGTLYRRNNIQLLKRAVDSILNQTFMNLEFIICDNGSSVEAMKYLESIDDHRIKIVRQDNCLDLASKLNLCLKEARGKYIARMDDDDLSFPNRLEKEIIFLQKYTNIGFIGCNVSLIQNGNEVGKRVLPEYPTVEDFYIVQPFIHPTLVFRKEVLKAVGGYSEDKDCILCEDYDLLLRIYKAGYKGANLQDVLFDYTIPLRTKDVRNMHHRINEMKTRYRRFRELGKMPGALPYVVKPVVMGLIPEYFTNMLKAKQWKYAKY